MGSGKTTLGKKLALELKVHFTDTDKIIAKHHGAITRIFETKGEP
jgi:shikimate kinase